MAIVDKSLAVGLRHSYARNSNEILDRHVNKMLKAGTDTLSFEQMLERNELICAKRRRGPAPGTVAGTDIVYIDHDREDGTLLFCFDMLDKHGEWLEGSSGRLLMTLSRHAVESLYQRLKTHDWKIVVNELRPVGIWFFENGHIVAIEEEGFLVTPSGVFPVVRGPRVKDDQLDGIRHWVATTWLSQAALEDHTPHKRRVAEAVRALGGTGIQFFKL